MQKPKTGYKFVKSIFGKYEEIPEEWVLTQFGDIARIKRGASPRPIDDPVYFGNGRGWIRISDVTKSHKYLENTEDYLSELGESKSVPVNTGDVIMSIAATVGKPVILKMKACIHDGFIAFSNLSESVNNEFLYYLLVYMENNLKSLGQHGTQSNINSAIVSGIKFGKPSLPEQQKIASILSNVDSLIQQTQKEMEQTEKFKKGLMQKLLTKGIRHTKFKKVKWNYGKLLEIPENWNVVLLDHIAKRGSGHTPDAQNPEYYDGEIKWISLADSSKLDNVYISETEKEISHKGVENSSAVIHPSGVVVLSRDAGVGKSAITTTEMAVSQHFMAWKCGDELNNHFLYYLLQFWKPFFEAIAIGTTIKTIGLPFFKKFQIILPPRKEQDVIASILLDTDKAIWKQKEYNSNLENLKKGLMQKLLTGQIRVKV